MAKGASSAKRTNRVIALLVALSFISTGLVAGFLKEPGAPIETASTTPPRPDVTGTGIRPAEGADWDFESNMGTEQFDYLSNLELQISLFTLSKDMNVISRLPLGTEESSD